VFGLVLIIESEFLVDTTHTRRLLTTTTPCACGNNLRQQFFGIVTGELVSFNFRTA